VTTLDVPPLANCAEPGGISASVMRTVVHFFTARSLYFFFSAFQMVRETARPQNGQKLIGYRFGLSSGERTA
jgi:hypothetical protein